MTSLVLPAYNPGSVVESTWMRLVDFLDRQSGSWEVILILDGCTDDTHLRIDRLKVDRRIRVLSYPVNRGKGYAVRTGLLAARGQYRIFTDVDLAYDFDEITRIAQSLWAGSAAAIASRTHPESEIRLPASMLGYAWRRQMQSAIFSRLVRSLLPVQTTDTQAGLKGFSADVIAHILPMTNCDGFGFDCELLTACHYCQIPVTEVPVQVHLPDRQSTTHFRSVWSMVRELWSIRRSWKKRVVPAYVAAAHQPRPVLKAA